MSNDKDSSDAGSKPMIVSFVRTRPAKSTLASHLLDFQKRLSEFQSIIIQRTSQAPHGSTIWEFNRVKEIFTKDITLFY